MKALIELKNIHKSYHLDGFDLEILKGINLQIQQGEFVAIMGPSGSGKSTLMNILGCLDTPSSGEYLLEGKNIESLNSDQLAEIRNNKIGFVFQGFNLISRTSALDNVAMPMIYKGIPEKERYERARKALKVVGLESKESNMKRVLKAIRAKILAKNMLIKQEIIKFIYLSINGFIYE